jgi:IS30 family transposase
MKEQADRWLSDEKWSPEIISVEGNRTGECPISTKSLYQWIWQSKHRDKASDKPYKKYLQPAEAWQTQKKTGIQAR